MKKNVQLTVAATALLALAACSSSDKDALQYTSTVKADKIRLDVPPDLTDPNQGNRYVIPAGSGAVRASDLNRGQEQNQATSTVLTQVANVHMVSDGAQRWLIMDGVSAQEIWPQLKVFWQEMGFTIGSEEPAIGFMETDWAENRAKLPNDGFRGLLEKVGLGSIYSTSERDKFISRMERTDKGIRVAFVHKGMEEVYNSRNKDNTVWQPRAGDPNLEAAFLGRFMHRFGQSEANIKQQLQQTETAGGTREFARIDGQSLVVQGDAERNWRRIGLALDRVGLTVRDIEPSQRLYIVQPTSAESEAVTNEKPGLFKRVFGSKPKPVQARENLVVRLQAVEGGDRLVILDRQGAPYQGSDLNQILSRLQTELR